MINFNTILKIIVYCSMTLPSMLSGASDASPSTPPATGVSDEQMVIALIKHMKQIKSRSTQCTLPT